LVGSEVGQALAVGRNLRIAPLRVAEQDLAWNERRKIGTEGGHLAQESARGGEQDQAASHGEVSVSEIGWMAR
jgi:hypothetical protein